MRVRGQGVRAPGDHPGLGDHGGDLLPWQMPAVPGLGPLPDLDLHRGHALEVFRLDAEAAGGHLRAYAVRVAVEVGVQPALPAPGHDVQLLGGHEQGLLGVVADRPQGYVPEHQGHIHADQGGVVLTYDYVAVPHLQPPRPAAEVGDRLHRFPQGVYGWIGHLGRVQQQVVEYGRVGVVSAAGGEQHPAGAGLGQDGPAAPLRPVAVRGELRRHRPDLDAVGRAEGDAAAAGHASTRRNHLRLLELQGLVGAFAHAALAHPAQVVVDPGHEPLGEAVLHALPRGLGLAHTLTPWKCGSVPRRRMPLPVTATNGLPAPGAQVLASGSAMRMALSSLAQ
ncbi:MAG: hypothetical protein A4E29_01331 [Methanomassiliicoccales archaeon PtaB.Bin134]|nr:MAG: hypothetical protein A4E29_01331 [Methanomassiliicoccales archaeon PtaB.Bin134]